MATQRVLDLLLVTERVRQEEKKRRVAAERVKEQVRWGRDGKRQTGVFRARTRMTVRPPLITCDDVPFRAQARSN